MILFETKALENMYLLLIHYFPLPDMNVGDSEFMASVKSQFRKWPNCKSRGHTDRPRPSSYLRKIYSWAFQELKEGVTGKYISLNGEFPSQTEYDLSFFF